MLLKAAAYGASFLQRRSVVVMERTMRQVPDAVANEDGDAGDAAGGGGGDDDDLIMMRMSSSAPSTPCVPRV